ncbi:hypothetical protein OIDMADRAFT_44274 [Oidiodendron maius Zn]|uniref:Alcohol dehydrogenase-like C-terminal domain-containing protein n=1 Tax=Oidiodendron maius (strain Zn) TaxID=913774 RepID=A0A0C3H2G4_OIDMZ|nr:hypothetical protein OIDMADRAFT_44274 [Oidiodendron maius Zn]
MTSYGLPETHRALVLSSTQKDIDAKVQTIPVPSATPGSAVVKVILASVLPYAREVYDGTRQYPMPLPYVMGSSAIARIVAVGPDAVKLAPGQLVLVDSYVRSRDDPDVSFLAGYTEGSKRLMRGEWRDWTYAEYAKVPLENCFPLDEERLLGPIEKGGLGYSVENLTQIPRLLVPNGGLKDINLQAGETIIIAPATGMFGGRAVDVALAMGAKAIAVGRNAKTLEKLASMNDRVKTVQLTMHVETDVRALQKFGPIDAFQDWSPPEAGVSTHIRSCIQALRVGGRASLMGGITGDISINYASIMFRNIQIRGNFMYSKKDIESLIKMVLAGVLKLGKENLVESFPLERWLDAFKAAEESTSLGKQILLAP